MNIKEFLHYNVRVLYPNYNTILRRQSFYETLFEFFL